MHEVAPGIRCGGNRINLINDQAGIGSTGAFSTIFLCCQRDIRQCDAGWALVIFDSYGEAAVILVVVAICNHISHGMLTTAQGSREGFTLYNCLRCTIINTNG